MFNIIHCYVFYFILLEVKAFINNLKYFKTASLIEKKKIQENVPKTESHKLTACAFSNKQTRL